MVFPWYFSLLQLVLVSAPVNTGCSAGFSQLHPWTSRCIAPEQKCHRAPKFSHLSGTGGTILSTHPGLSSTVLLNFSSEVTCPWFSLVIVLVLWSLCQQLGVWWLKGRRSQDIKTSGFSGVGFFPECCQICFPLSSLRSVISAWMPCMPVVTHDLYSRMKITSHEKNSTGGSSQASLGFLRTQSFLIMVYVTGDQNGNSYWRRLCLVTCMPVNPTFQHFFLEPVWESSSHKMHAAGSAIQQGGRQGCHDNQLHTVRKDDAKWPASGCLSLLVE